MSVKKVVRPQGKEDLSREIKKLLDTGRYTYNEAKKKAMQMLKKQSRKL